MISSLDRPVVRNFCRHPGVLNKNSEKIAYGNHKKLKQNKTEQHTTSRTHGGA